MPKQCNICHRWFEKHIFPPGRARCKECHSEKQKVSRWKSVLKRKYGITPAVHEAIYKDQNGRCYFCDEPKPSKGTSGLGVDHDQVTGFVRGLLCRSCNANWVDEYRKLPPEYQDSPRTNAYLRRGETGHYIKSIKRRWQTELGCHPTDVISFVAEASAPAIPVPRPPASSPDPSPAGIARGDSPANPHLTLPSTSHKLEHMYDSQTKTETSEHRQALAEFVREETDGGREIMRFFLDVMRNRFEDAKLCHRIAAALELRPNTGR